MSQLELVLTTAGFIAVSSSMLLINKLALKAMPLPSLLSDLQFVAAVLFVLLLKAFGVAEPDPFKWSTVRAYAIYVSMFTASIYTNMRAISASNLETVMVFRAFAPVFISGLDFTFMGRDAPSARSSLALIMISAGATGYVALDKSFIVGGMGTYFFCFIYLSVICIEITYAKHILQSDLLKSKWGPTLYTNTLALVPMTLTGISTGERLRLGEVNLSDLRVVGMVLLSCMMGTAMSYLVFRLTSLVSATKVSVLGVANKFITICLNYIVLPNEHASPMGIVSVLVCLLGAALYQQSPMRDAAAEADGKGLPVSSIARAATPVGSVVVVVLMLFSVDARTPAGAAAKISRCTVGCEPKAHAGATLAKGTTVAPGNSASKLFDKRLAECLHNTKSLVDKKPDALPLAPYVYGGRRQVDTRDAFGRLLYCEAATMPRLNHFLDVFLFSGSGSTWSIAQGLQHKHDRLKGLGQRTGSIVAWESDAERFRLAQTNLMGRFPSVTKHLRNRFTLERDGKCNVSSACNVGPTRLLHGDLYDRCTGHLLENPTKPGSKRVSTHAIDVSVHDGDVAHGLNDLDEWQVINKKCQPAVVNIFNTNIHPSHARMVEQLDADPAWRKIAHGWVPFERHFRYKNRTYHAYMHTARYMNMKRNRTPQ